MLQHLRLLMQVPGTLAILAWLPGNGAKLLALLLLWWLGFGRISRREGWFFTGVCLFFSGMNLLALRQGIFAFRHPDLLGLPWYEFFMWGFYLLHSWRLLDGAAASTQNRPAWALALLYAAAFGGIAHATALLLVTAALLALGLLLFHQRLDLAYTGYLLLLGAAVEYTGVHSGQWQYPGAPLGGVPLWFATLWAGVGLFMRRLMVPLLRPGTAANT
jgi:uncharacterized membrane protein YoaT (DUF817 family)